MRRKITTRLCGCYLKLEKFGDLKWISNIHWAEAGSQWVPFGRKKYKPHVLQSHTLLELESSPYSLSEKKRDPKNWNLEGNAQIFRKSVYYYWICCNSSHVQMGVDTNLKHYDGKQTGSSQEQRWHWSSSCFSYRPSPQRVGWGIPDSTGATLVSAVEVSDEPHARYLPWRSCLAFQQGASIMVRKQRWWSSSRRQRWGC